MWSWALRVRRVCSFSGGLGGMHGCEVTGSRIELINSFLKEETVFYDGCSVLLKLKKFHILLNKTFSRWSVWGPGENVEKQKRVLTVAVNALVHSSGIGKHGQVRVAVHLVHLSLFCARWQGRDGSFPKQAAGSCPCGPGGAGPAQHQIQLTEKRFPANCSLFTRWFSTAFEYSNRIWLALPWVGTGKTRTYGRGWVQICKHRKYIKLDFFNKLWFHLHLFQCNWNNHDSDLSLVKIIFLNIFLNLF